MVHTACPAHGNLQLSRHVSCRDHCDVAADRVPLRARVHAGDTCVRADAACAAVSYCGQRGNGSDRVGEYDVRDTVRLACVGCRQISDGRSHALRGGAGRVNRHRRLNGGSNCRILWSAVAGIRRGFRTPRSDAMDSGAYWRAGEVRRMVLHRLGDRSRAGRIAMWLLVPAAFAASFAWSHANHRGRIPGGRPPACGVLRCGTGRCGVHRNSRWEAGIG